MLFSSRHRLMIPLLIGLLSAESANAGDAFQVEVTADGETRRDTILDVALPKDVRHPGNLTLTRLGTGESIPVQVDRTQQPWRLVWKLRGTMKPKDVRRYRLVATARKSAAARVTVSNNGKRLLFRTGGRNVLAYNHATVASPNPKEPYYARSGYIHPVYNPAGQVVTDDFNPDHAHQHGIMFAWRKMKFEGRSTNGWDQKAKVGKVEHVKLEAFGGGPVFGSMKSRLRHVDLTAAGGKKTALNETWGVRVYDVDDGFLFDVTSTQQCASASPVTIEKFHYGGMMIRGHSDWQKRRNSDFLTSEGKSKKNGNQSRPRWVDLFGPVKGKTTGMTVLDHPGNSRFPQPVRLHPTMPYFCFAPSAMGSFVIRPGKPFVSRYRFYVHNGAVDVKTVRRLWQDYSSPPGVRITPEKK